jgi:hypothetical protein
MPFVPYGKKAKQARARHRFHTAGRAAEVSENVGSRWLAGLQRRAIDPALTEAAAAVLPALRQHLRAIAGVNEESEALVNEVLGELAEGFASPEDEHRRNERLDALSDLVGKAAGGLGVTPLDDVTVGVLHTRTVDAFSATLFGEANIIGVHIPLMIFAYLIAKATATFALVDSPFDSDGAEPRIPEKEYRLGLRWLTQLVHSVAVDNDPIGIHPYAPPPTWPFWPVVVAWTDGIEIFILAHEYAHLLHARDSIEELRRLGLLGRDESLDDLVTSELAADRFALKVTWQVKESAAHAYQAAFGPLTFLWFLARLETEAGRPLRGPNHPGAADRLAHAEKMFPSSEDAAIWGVMKRRLDAAWSIAARASRAVDPASKL